MKNHFAKLFLLLAVALMSCQGGSKSVNEDFVSKAYFPEWSQNAAMYEVNVRQFTEEGTFNAFAAHLPRLQEMGVKILWFMPITPIGELNRKGSLGSYYSVKDYTGINPEFGTIEDFKALVEDIHGRGMYVIVDWVANHTAWDHPWTITNPEYYTRDEEGNFVPPVEDWSDVIDLDYDNKELWVEMIAAMRYWVEEVGIDGFRCDVADMVPVEFWDEARKELDSVKPVLMLAEAEKPELHTHAFNVGYGWNFHHIMNKVANGESKVADIDAYFFEGGMREFPQGAYRINFIDNHDENSWAGTVFTRLGLAKEAMAVLAATSPGMLLMYNGQEAGLDWSLEFFEKDQIDWSHLKYESFYKKLLTLKLKNKALWNGLAGGDMKRVNTSDDSSVFAFTRTKDADQVLVVLNLSDKVQDVTLQSLVLEGEFSEIFSGASLETENGLTMSLDSWAYRVFVKQ